MECGVAGVSHVKFCSGPFSLYTKTCAFQHNQAAGGMNIRPSGYPCCLGWIECFDISVSFTAFLAFFTAQLQEYCLFVVWQWGTALILSSAHPLFLARSHQHGKQKKTKKNKPKKPKKLKRKLTLNAMSFCFIYGAFSTFNPRCLA